MNAAKLLPLKRLVDSTRPITYGIVQAGENDPTGVPYIRPVDMTHQDGVADTSQLLRTSHDIAHAYQRSKLRAGDIVISIGPSYGKTMMVEKDLAGANLTQGTARVAVDRRYFPPYVRWALRSSIASAWWDAAVGGATFRALNLEPLSQTPIPDWPMATQRAIAGYLDRETARIDTVIAAKRRMRGLLDERRRALRDDAFAAKPGWKLKRLLSAPMAYGVLVPEFVEPGTGIPMIRTYNLTAKGHVSHENIAEIPISLAKEYRRTSLLKADLILSVVGSMGRAAVVSSGEQGFNLNRPLARLRLRPEVPSRLIWHWTQTTHFMDLAKLAIGGGTAQPTLNLGDLANFVVGLSQRLERWSDSLAALEDGCRLLDGAEDTLGRQVERLQERRQALITAAVTGQLDVPGAA